jgi:hypothetical protein
MAQASAMDKPEPSSLQWLIASDFAQTKTKDRKRIVGSHVMRKLNAEKRRKNVERFNRRPLLLSAKGDGLDRVTDVTDKHDKDYYHGDSGSEIVWRKERPYSNSFSAACYEHGILSCYLCAFQRMQRTVLDKGRRDPFSSLPGQGPKVDRIVSWCGYILCCSDVLHR